MSSQPQSIERGYGWVIVGAVFSILFLSLGIMFSVGSVFDILIVEFNCEKSEVSAMVSIAVSFQCCMAPLVSTLLSKYSARQVVLIGAFLVSASLILSSFASSVYALYLTFGVIGGTGLGMIYLSGTVIVSFYFDRRRGIATALSGIGSHLGTFVVPYIMRLLMTWTTWQGVFLVLGGVAMNSFCFGILLRPVDVKKRLQQSEKAADDSSFCTDMNSMNSTDSSRALQAFIEENIAGCRPLDAVKEEPELTEDEESEEGDSAFMLEKQASSSAGGYSRSTSEAVQSKPVSGSSEKMSRKEFYKMKSAVEARRRENSGTSKDLVKHAHSWDAEIMGSKSKSSPRLRAQRSVFNRGFRDPALYERGFSKVSNISSFLNLYTDPTAAFLMPRLTADLVAENNQPITPTAIRQFSRQVSHLIGVSISEEPDQPVSTSETSDETDKLKSSIDKTSKHNVSQAEEPQRLSAGSDRPENINRPVDLAINDFRKDSSQSSISVERSLTHLKAPRSSFRARVSSSAGRITLLFKNPVFSAIFLHSFVKCLAYFAPSLYIAGWSNELGFTSGQTTLLFSLIGIGNLIGRPVMALISDLFYTHRLTLLSLAYVVSGLCFLPALFLNDFSFIAFLIFQYAFFVGGAQTLTAPIVADLVPLNKLSFAFSLMLASEGMASLFGPPLLGFLPSYPITFAAMGIVFLVAGSVVAIGANTGKFCKSSFKTDDISE